MNAPSGSVGREVWDAAGEADGVGADLAGEAVAVLGLEAVVDKDMVAGAKLQ